MKMKTAHAVERMHNVELSGNWMSMKYTNFCNRQNFCLLLNNNSMSMKYTNSSIEMTTLPDTASCFVYTNPNSHLNIFSDSCPGSAGDYLVNYC
jgi:hypothetical protein